MGREDWYRSEAGNGDTNMVVDLEDLLLVRGELRRGAFECCEDGMGLGAKAHTRASLLHCLTGVLNLVDPPLQKGISCQIVKNTRCRRGRGSETACLKQHRIGMVCTRSAPEDSM